jgi:hypothetical protein
MKTEAKDERRAIPLADGKQNQSGYLIHCPACGYGHFFNVEQPGPNGQQWTFNGDLMKPTFSPSMLVLPPGRRCHSFVREGRIEYLSDCEHAMAGKTVDLPAVCSEDDDVPRATPPCRVCGINAEVICYPDDHSQTICPDCCGKSEDGHEWKHDYWERDHVCEKCGIARRCTDEAFDD